MTIVLRNQFEASERSARELEAQIQANETTNRYDVEDQLRNLVNVFNNLTRDVERWQQKLNPAEGAASEIDWERQYVRLEELFSGAAKLIHSLKRYGYTVDGESAFQAVWRDLRGIVSFSREQVAAGAGQIERAEVRPLSEVMNELSDRVVD